MKLLDDRCIKKWNQIFEGEEVGVLKTPNLLVRALDEGINRLYSQNRNHHVNLVKWKQE